MVSLLSTDDGSVRGQHKVDTRIRHQVGLELGDIDVEGTIETKGGGQRRDNLSNQPVQVGVGGPLNIQVTTADIVQSLVVDLVGDISVLQQGMDAKDRVVGLDHGRGHLRAGPHREGDLRLLAVVNGEALQEQAAETRPSAAAARVEDPVANS